MKGFQSTNNSNDMVKSKHGLKGEASTMELYTKAKIDNTLKTYNLFEETDPNCNLLDLKADLDRALESNALDSTMRKALACEYALEVSLLQGAKLVGVSLREYREALDDALETLEAVLNGYKSKRLRVGKPKALNYTEYLDEVGAGTISIYSITIQVRHSLLHFLSKKGDTLSRIALGHTVTEDKDIAKQWLDLDDDEGEEYPFYVTSSAIEDPNRTHDYVDWKVSGDDGFRQQDRNRGVVFYGDLSIVDNQPTKDGNRKKKTVNKEEA